VKIEIYWDESNPATSHSLASINPSMTRNSPADSTDSPTTLLQSTISLRDIIFAKAAGKPVSTQGLPQVTPGFIVHGFVKSCWIGLAPVPVGETTIKIFLFKPLRASIHITQVLRPLVNTVTSTFFDLESTVYPLKGGTTKTLLRGVPRRACPERVTRVLQERTLIQLMGQLSQKRKIDGYQILPYPSGMVVDFDSERLDMPLQNGKLGFESLKRKY